MKKTKTILVAPLFWGLGHATRCIPIIQGLLEEGYQVILGSDGDALILLRYEFPDLPFITLPSYHITYAKHGIWLSVKLLLHAPRVLNAIKKEKAIVCRLVAEGKIQGIISDNRLGVRHQDIPSVYITHQLQIQSGFTSFLSSKLHQYIIKKYHQCWVPDVEGYPNISGELGHPNKINFSVEYIGPLSRMQHKVIPIQYDVLVLLSGPEPQRTILEEILYAKFCNTSLKVLLVRGLVEPSKELQRSENVTIVDYLETSALEIAVNQSKTVVSRSGYTTIMDLAAMEKDAFLIPTPGQYEQQYLAKELRQQGIVPSCSQDQFTIEKLNQIKEYKGLRAYKNTNNFRHLLALFEGK